MNVRVLGALIALLLLARRKPRAAVPLVVLALLVYPHEHWLLAHDAWLKLLAARGAAFALTLTWLPVALSDAVDPALVYEHMRVRVTSECAGFETLLPLATLGAVVSALLLRRVAGQVLFMVLTVAGGFAANVVRIALSARVAHALPPASDAWQSLHDAIGYALFVLTYGLLILSALMLRSCGSKERRATAEPPGDAALDHHHAASGS